jgi:hypothetical protein
MQRERPEQARRSSTRPRLHPKQLQRARRKRRRKRAAWVQRRAARVRTAAMQLPIIGAHNLSSMQCTTAQLSLLNKGLKFTPTAFATPKQIDSNTAAALRAFERSIRLRHLHGLESQPPDGIAARYWTHAHEFHVPKPSYVPPRASLAVESFLADVRSALETAARTGSSPDWQAASRQHTRPNLSKEERAALLALRAVEDKDRTVIIKPADKNLGLTIMDKSWYEGEMDRQLGDPSCYAPVPPGEWDETLRGVRAQLWQCVHTWQQYGIVPESTAAYMLLGESKCTLPDIYLIPKIHKTPVKGRVICPSHSWVTTNVSTWLAAELNELVRHQPTVLMDARELIRELQGMTVSRDAVLVTFDVESLYPNIDTAVAVSNVGSFIDHSLKRQCVEELLTFVMQNNYFRFRDKTYHQTHGTAMGTAVAPPYANLDLARFETGLLSERLEQPTLYKRFIDDGFIVWEGSENELQQLLHAWNTRRPRIRITFEISRLEVHFLDLRIWKDMDCAEDRLPLVVSTYEKPMNKYLYIPLLSMHRVSVLRGFIRSRLLNFVVTNTYEHDFLVMRAKLWVRLLRRGYTPQFLTPIFAAVSFDLRREYLTPKPAATQSKGRAALFMQLDTFTGGMANVRGIIDTVYAKHATSPEVQAVLDSAAPMVVYKRGRSLASALVNAKH